MDPRFKPGPTRYDCVACNKESVVNLLAENEQRVTFTYQGYLCNDCQDMIVRLIKREKQILTKL